VVHSKKMRILMMYQCDTPIINLLLLNFKFYFPLKTEIGANADKDDI
jgi:hypothetical protein